MSEPIVAIVIALFAYFAVWLMMRRYFVELITIIVLGFLLVALCLPSVQAARERARTPRASVQE